MKDINYTYKSLLHLPSENSGIFDFINCMFVFHKSLILFIACLYFINIFLILLTVCISINKNGSLNK